VRESSMIGASEVGKAASRREPRPSGTEYLPSTFTLGGAGVGGQRQLMNPLAIQGASRAMGRSYVRLMRAATSKRRRDKLSDDEAQYLVTQLIQGANLANRPL
jgi:hypothetical protein